MNIAGKQKPRKRMNSEDKTKGEGGVAKAAGEPVPESKVEAINKGGARVHLVSFDGSRKIEEADQSVDGDAAFQAWIKAFEDFDR
jgi:hypothetical protein